MPLISRDKLSKLRIVSRTPRKSLKTNRGIRVKSDEIISHRQKATYNDAVQPLRKMNLDKFEQQDIMKHGLKVQNPTADELIKNIYGIDKVQKGVPVDLTKNYLSKLNDALDTMSTVQLENIRSEIRRQGHLDARGKEKIIEQLVRMQTGTEPAYYTSETILPKSEVSAMSYPSETYYLQPPERESLGITAPPYKKPVKPTRIITQKRGDIGPTLEQIENYREQLTQDISRELYLIERPASEKVEISDKDIEEDKILAELQSLEDSPAEEEVSAKGGPEIFTESDLGDVFYPETDIFNNTILKRTEKTSVDTYVDYLNAVKRKFNTPYVFNYTKTSAKDLNSKQISTKDLVSYLSNSKGNYYPRKGIYVRNEYRDNYSKDKDQYDKYIRQKQLA